MRGTVPGDNASWRGFAWSIGATVSAGGRGTEKSWAWPDGAVRPPRLLEDAEGGRESPVLRAFLEAASFGAAEYLRFDPTIVRGLDYYTGTVFEARDPEGRLRAILGGGRYDSLVSDVGGERVAATGFAMGDVTISLLIEQVGAPPGSLAPPAQILLCWLDEEARLVSLRTANDLRRAGVAAEWYPSPERLPRQLKYADRQGIPLALILGSREIERGEFALKDLRDGSQVAVPRDQLVSRVLEIVGRGK
jgi:histidyl-tRNA synthetase